MSDYPPPEVIWWYFQGACEWGMTIVPPEVWAWCTGPWIA